MNCSDLSRALVNGRAPAIIDVRSLHEYRQGHIPGAMHLPLLKLFFRLATPPEDRTAPYLLVCEHGPRAQLASSILQRRGFSRLDMLDGHMHRWRAQGLPLER